MSDTPPTSDSAPPAPTVTDPDRPVRLDLVLVQRGLATTRGRAQQLVAAGSVLVQGVAARRVSQLVTQADDVRLADAASTYVSRAAGKLIGALDDLQLTPSGRALDAGASTGGFTQVLLERGCTEVVTVDVGRDQLAEPLRSDPRVRVHEGLHLRDLDLAHVGGTPVDWVVADVSFVSLTKIIAPLVGVVDPGGSLLLMVKPQFELGKGRVGKGVVRDPRLQAEAVRGVVAAASELGWRLHAAVMSLLPGPAGNQEFFVLLRRAEPARARNLTHLGPLSPLTE
ncbi:MAG: TlyA family RNA methyltransferase [Propionibacteriaceae bacterium]